MGGMGGPLKPLGLSSSHPINHINTHSNTVISYFNKAIKHKKQGSEVPMGPAVFLFLSMYITRSVLGRDASFCACHYYRLVRPTK